MQRAAMGLAKAMQYGIDQYPAIVFDGDLAIYGVTDINGWRSGRHSASPGDAEGVGGGRVDSEGDYVWNLWRPYKCCQRRGQWFLFDIDWISYPP